MSLRACLIVHTREPRVRDGFDGARTVSGPSAFGLRRRGGNSSDQSDRSPLGGPAGPQDSAAVRFAVGHPHRPSGLSGSLHIGTGLGPRCQHSCRESLLSRSAWRRAVPRQGVRDTAASSTTSRGWRSPLSLAPEVFFVVPQVSRPSRGSQLVVAPISRMTSVEPSATPLLRLDAQRSTRPPSHPRRRPGTTARASGCVRERERARDRLEGDTRVPATTSGRLHDFMKEIEPRERASAIGVACPRVVVRAFEVARLRRRTVDEPRRADAGASVATAAGVEPAAIICLPRERELIGRELFEPHVAPAL